MARASAGASCAAHQVRCVWCGASCGPRAFVEYSPGTIKLKRCGACSLVADPYVELEPLLVAGDVLLHKRPAMRHVLLNAPLRGGGRDLRWAVLVNIMFESYIRLQYRVGALGAGLELWSLASAVAAAAACHALATCAAVCAAQYGSQSARWDVLARGEGDQPYGRLSGSSGSLALALALGGSLKSLFLVMSIWSYPLSFLLALRALSVSCTAGALGAVLHGAPEPALWAVAVMVVVLQSLGARPGALL
jgi:hypothetical protein